MTWGWPYDNPRMVLWWPGGGFMTTQGGSNGDLGVASWQPQDGRWPGCGLPTTQGRSVTWGWPNDNPGMVLQWPGGWPRDNPWMVNDLGVASWQPLDGQWPGGGLMATPGWSVTWDSLTVTWGWPHYNAWMVDDLGVASWQPREGLMAAWPFQTCILYSL